MQALRRALFIAKTEQPDVGAAATAEFNAMLGLLAFVRDYIDSDESQGAINLRRAIDEILNN